MTSNVVNNNSVGFMNKENNTLNENFSKEFLGRFNDVITFNYIPEDILKEYTTKNLTNKNIKFAQIKQEAECEKYGFRNLKNIIQKYNSEIDIEIPL